MSVVTITRAVLKHERALVVTVLVAVCVLSWAYLFQGAGMGMSLADMMAWPVTQPISMSAPMPGHMAGIGWSVAKELLILAMWWVMMIAMMVPSAAPAILLYARVSGWARQDAMAAGALPVMIFAVGYLLSWLGFSIMATAAQFGLERLGLIQAMAMTSTSAILSAIFLLLAGLYQFSSLKSVCLDHCRAPVNFLVAHWRPGQLGALRMGMRHGFYCVGCCWTLMALLFVGGVMNLVWIVGLASLVLMEKAAPYGGRLGQIAGGIMISIGTFLLLTSILGG